MSFEIYSLGDVHTTYDVMNGIAMLMNTSFFTGSGGLGLGNGALLGALLLLMIMVYKAAFAGKIDFQSLIVPILVYMVLTVPKTDVIIHDIYKVEADRRVSNIPVGLALPASAMSGFNYAMSSLLEEALYVLPGGNSAASNTKITDTGFLTPLQVLNAIRYDNIGTTAPYFQKAFTQVYANCIAVNPQFNSTTYHNSTDGMKYMLDIARSSMNTVNFVTTQAGETVDKLMTCADGANFIQSAFLAHIDGQVDPTGLLGSNFQRNQFKEKMAKILATKDTFGKNKGSNGIIKYSRDDVHGLLGSSLNLSTVQSQAFMTNVLFDPLVRSAANCMDEADRMNHALNVGRCSTWVAANEQWKDTTAASATSFLKNLKNGQNLLIFTGFMLYPIIVFIIMMSGLNSFKIVSGYTIFLLSNYLWLPFATIINFYSQHTMAEALHLIHQSDPSGLLTIAGYPELYDMVTSKLAIANNSMGMIPILTTMLFGGMTFGMNAVVAGMNAGNNYNAKVESKDITQSAGLSTQSSLTMRNGMGANSIVGVGEISLKTMDSLSAVASKSNELGEKISDNVGRLKSLAETVSQSESLSASQGSGHSHSEEEKKQYVSSIVETFADNLKDFKGTVTDAKILLSEYGVSLDVTKFAGFSDNKSLAAQMGLSIDTNKKKLMAAIDLGGSLGLQVNSGSSMQATSTNTDADFNKEDPTYKATVNRLNEVKKSAENSHKLAAQERIDKIDSSNDYDYKARAYGQIISGDKSGSLSVQDQQAASRLVTDVSSDMKQRTQLAQIVSGMNISDRDISGMINPYSRSQDNVRAGLDKADELGAANVPNWEELKEKGRHVLIKGGQVTQDGIESSAIFYAAQISGNTDTVLAATQAVTGGFDGLDKHREVFSVGSKVEQEIAAGQQRMAGITASDSEIKALDESNAKTFTDAKTIARFQNVSTNVARANGLVNQEFKEPERVNVNISEFGNIEEKQAAIMAMVQKNVDALAQEMDRYSHLVTITNPDGSQKQVRVANEVDPSGVKAHTNPEITKLNNMLKNATETGDPTGVTAAISDYNKANKVNPSTQDVVETSGLNISPDVTRFLNQSNQVIDGKTVDQMVEDLKNAQKKPQD